MHICHLFMVSIVIFYMFSSCRCDQMRKRATDSHRTESHDLRAVLILHFFAEIISEIGDHGPENLFSF